MTTFGKATLARLLDRFGRVDATFTRPATGFDESTLAGTGEAALGTVPVAVPFREMAGRTRSDQDVDTGGLITYLENVSELIFLTPEAGDEVAIEGVTYRISEGTGLDRSADALRLILREIG